MTRMAGQGASPSATRGPGSTARGSGTRDADAGRDDRVAPVRHGHDVGLGDRPPPEGPLPLQDDEDEPVDTGAVTDKGISMLDVFHAHVAKTMNGHTVEGVEVPFVAALHDPDTGEVLDERLVGVIDLVLRHGDHRTVVELKTAARKWSEDQLAYDIQPTGYAFAGRQVGMGDVGLQLQVVTKTKVPVVQVADVERAPRDEDDFLRTAVGVLRAVDAGVAYPVRGWACKGCQFAHACKPKRPRLALVA